MISVTNIEAQYQSLYNNMSIRPDWQDKARNAAKTVLFGRNKYEALCARFNSRMPWYFPGILHMMECNCNFNKHLHNGDSLSRRTVNQPAGRPLADPWNGKGAPYTWIESAIDALSMPGKSYQVQQSWTLPLMLSRLERYNGTGYIRQGVYSPYLWSGTSYYTAGKFVKDGVYNPSAVSSQVGAAVLLRYLTDKTLMIY